MIQPFSIALVIYTYIIRILNIDLLKWIDEVSILCINGLPKAKDYEIKV